MKVVRPSHKGNMILIDDNGKEDWYFLNQKVQKFVKDIIKEGDEVEIQFNQEDKNKTIYFIKKAGEGQPEEKKASTKSTYSNIDSKEKQSSIERQTIANATANTLNGMEGVTSDKVVNLIIEVFNTYESLVCPVINTEDNPE